VAQTPEGKVKDWLVRYILKYFPDAWIYKAPAGRYGRKGVPDLLCSIKGIFVAIEVKADNGTLSQYQDYEIKKLDKSEALTLVIYGKDEAKLRCSLRRVLSYYKGDRISWPSGCDKDNT